MQCCTGIGQLLVFISDTCVNLPCTSTPLEVGCECANSHSHPAERASSDLQLHTLVIDPPFLEHS